MSDALERAARKLEPRLAEAFRRAVKGIRDESKVKAIARALEAGNVDEALRLAGIDVVDAAFDPLKSELRSGVEAGAAVAAVEIAGHGFVPSALHVRFDMLNPRTLEYIREYELNLIQQINEATKEAIRQNVIDGLRRGENPIAVARSVRANIGLTARQAQSVENFRRELETFHLRQSAEGWNLGGSKSKAPSGRGVMVLDAQGRPADKIMERRLRDFRFDPTLRRAMRQGDPIPQDKIDRMVERYRARWLKYRSETIARTEALRSAHVGSHQQWVQAVENGQVEETLVRRFWRDADDARVSPSHGRIEHMNTAGVGLREPFNTPNGPRMLPPLRPNCRCAVVVRVYEPGQAMPD